MKNKGFTLIELLAVIVILAIIALIATPIILNIIDNTKEQSVKRSIDHYLSAATTAIARKNLNNTSASFNPSTCEILAQGTKLDCDGTEIDVKVDGTKPTSGTITFENGKITGFTDINIDGNTCNLQDGEIVCSGSEVTPNPDPNPGEGEEVKIYRNSTDVLNVGNSINTNNRWCVVTQESASSCVYNNITDNDDEGINEVFNSEEECETALEELREGYPGLLENASCEPGTLSYETNQPNTNVYLKHVVEANEIKESFACITYDKNGTRQEVCVKGGDSSYHASNLSTLHTVEGDFNALFNGSCEIDDLAPFSYCRSDSLSLNVGSDGDGYASGGNSICYVDRFDSTYCNG